MCIGQRFACRVLDITYKGSVAGCPGEPDGENDSANILLVASRACIA
jgi:hypothetical protein